MCDPNVALGNIHSPLPVVTFRLDTSSRGFPECRYSWLRRLRKARAQRNQTRGCGRGPLWSDELRGLGHFRSSTWSQSQAISTIVWPTAEKSHRGEVRQNPTLPWQFFLNSLISEDPRPGLRRTPKLAQLLPTSGRLMGERLVILPNHTLQSENEANTNSGRG